MLDEASGHVGIPSNGGSWMSMPVGEDVHPRIGSQRHGRGREVIQSVRGFTTLFLAGELL